MNNFKSSTWKLIFKIYDEYFYVKTVMLSCKTTIQMKAARDFYWNVRDKWRRLFLYETDKYFWSSDRLRVTNRIQNQMREIEEDFDKLFDKHLERCKYVFD